MQPGYKASELWLAVATTATVALNKKLGLELSPTDILTMAGIAAGYIGSRWHLKALATEAPKP